MNRIIDTHAHLEQIKDLAAALERADKAGVAAIIAVGVDLASNQAVLEISRRFTRPKIYPALGLHPGNLKPAEFSPALKLIEDNIAQLVAVGEIGLDFWYQPARKDEGVRRLQQEIFTRQLELARREHKPVIVHSRGAWQECLEAVVRQKMEQVVFHWYSGPEDVLEEILNRGYFISATPSAEYSPEHQRAVRKAPLEQLFVETDAPVVFKPLSGQYEAEPRDVLRALKAAAELKNITVPELTRRTTENAREFFRGTVPRLS